MQKGVFLAFANFPCPHCGLVDTHQILDGGKDAKAFQWIEEITPDETWNEFQRWHSITRCARCARETYRLIEKGPRRVSVGSLTGGPVPDESKSAIRVLHQYPVGAPAGAGVPTDVRAAWDEAEKCLAVGASNAAGTMARRAVDALAQNKGAEGKDVYERLASLRDKAIIIPDLYEMAEELRIAGKKGAHPEWEDLNPDQAEYAVRLLRELVRFVYVMPAERSAIGLKKSAARKPAAPKG